MKKYQIVIDTNVFFSALLSRNGASFRLLSLIASELFEINLSILLVLEYEDVAKRYIDKTGLNEADIDAVLDYICKVGNHQDIYFLWRPFLKAPKDDMVLELALVSKCDFIVTYNKADFIGSETFGIEAITAKEFLEKIGALS